MKEVVNKILINVEDDETRIALLNGDHLENLYIEQTDRTQKVGNIYCGKVVKIQPSFQAAFIDFGEERHGFLSISDINFQVYRPKNEGRGRSSISSILKVGQKILVQVIKDEIAHKGASLSTNISKSSNIFSLIKAFKNVVFPLPLFILTNVKESINFALKTFVVFHH